MRSGSVSAVLAVMVSMLIVLTDSAPAFAQWNKVSSIGYAIMALSMAFFALLLVEAAVRRRKGEANPWGEGATTLEWTLSSPPPFHQFNTLPRIAPDPN